MAGRLDQAPAASAGTLSGRLDPLSVHADQEPGTMMPQDVLFDVDPHHVGIDRPLLGPEPPMLVSTEREMLDLLHQRYSQTAGNGSRFVCAEHVRNRAGFDANRTADFVAMDVWPSSGLPLHGHEVKVSRADWLRELADPAKAEAFRRFMDYWWLAVPDKRIVRDDLPDGWGLLVVRSGRLTVAHPAPRLSPEPLPRTLLASLLRATVATAKRQMERGR